MKAALLLVAAIPVMTADELRGQCEAGGGCVLVERYELEQAVNLIELQKRQLWELRRELAKERSKACI